MEEKLTFDLNGIKECQKNRYPLLFIDKVIEAVPGKSATAIKNFTYNEWFFPAHFEDDPNVPGFVLVETLVQTFIMTFLCMDEYKGMETSFINIDKVRFRQKVVPGDQLQIVSELKSFRHGVAKGTAAGYVEDALVCSAEFVVAIPKVLDKLKPETK